MRACVTLPLQLRGRSDPARHAFAQQSACQPAKRWPRGGGRAFAVRLP